jgi:hypothetical protein
MKIYICFLRDDVKTVLHIWIVELIMKLGKVRSSFKIQVLINFIKGAIGQDHNLVNSQNLEVHIYDNEIQNTELYLVAVK